MLQGLDEATQALPDAQVFSCGPDRMLRAVADFSREKGLPCQVSLEARMACGFGACVGCVTRVKAADGFVYKKVCHDGPVFDAETLAWDA